MRADEPSWITEHIAVAGQSVAIHSQTRTAHGFRALISLDGSLDDAGADRLGYDDWFCSEMRDGPGNDARTFARVVETLSLMVRGAPPVLVHCHAGRSRSVAVVAGYLVRRENMAPQAAFDYIARRRETAVQPELVTLVEQLAARWRMEDRL